MTGYERAMASFSMVERCAAMSSQERREAMADKVEQAKALTGKRFKRADLARVEETAMYLAKGHGAAEARSLVPLALQLKEEGGINDAQTDEYLASFRNDLELTQQIHQSFTSESRPISEGEVFEKLLIVQFHALARELEAATHIALITRAFRVFIGSDEVRKFAVEYWDAKGWDAEFLDEWDAFTKSLIAEATIS